MISPCGINCETCPAYQVSITNDVEGKQKLAREWSNPNCQFEAEEIYCTGCLNSEWKMTKVCHTRNCCKSKNLTSCAYCETYPCAKCERNENLDALRSRE